jgi:hypothetical protein
MTPAPVTWGFPAEEAAEAEAEAEVAAAPDQCLVLLAEIETQPAPHAFKTIGAETPLDKGGGHDPPTEWDPHLGTECQRVFAAHVSVADIGVPVIGQIVLQVDLIHETRFHVVALCEHDGVDAPRDSDRGRCDEGPDSVGRSGIPELPTDNASQRPPAPIPLEFNRGLVGMDL